MIQIVNILNINCRSTFDFKMRKNKDILVKKEYYLQWCLSPHRTAANTACHL